MGTQKTIHDPQQIEEILSKAKFLRLALSDADFPYIVPIAFGYKENAIYLHSSQKGKKIDILKKNHRVCFEAESEAEVMTADDPCKYNGHYRIVIGFGQAKFLEDYDEKVKGLTILSNIMERMGILSLRSGKLTGFA